ncbi:MAG TPA: hypothetical protein VKN99_20515 [Polyangia bacterium]|nr:hypothetical protein [Polyangia bacterium]
MKPGMVSVLLLVAVTTGPACRPRLAGDAEASAKYRAAWEKRQAGNEEAYQAMMKEIATRWPESRAGRRARQVTASEGGGGQGTMMGAAMAGVMAAVAIPAFMKYRAQSSGVAAGPVGITPPGLQLAPGLPLSPHVSAEPTEHVPRGRPANAQKGWEPLATPAHKR